MSNDEQYTPTLEDEALQASLLTVGIMGLVHQLYTDGKYSLDTHNLLYEAARKADAQVRYLLRMIEATEQELKMLRKPLLSLNTETGEVRIVETNKTDSKEK